MTFERPGLGAFVPKGDNTTETATLLVNLADKHGIDQRSIQVANDGFYITEELADLIYEDDDEETTVGDLAADLNVPDPSAADPAGTIAADREQIELAEEIAETGENVTVEEAPDTVTNDAIEDTDTSGATADVDYESWDYADLKAEVNRRGLDVENQKADTLIAALKADDTAQTTDDETVE